MPRQPSLSGPSSPPRRRRPASLACGVVVSALLLAGCGSAAPSETPATPAAASTTPAPASPTVQERAEVAPARIQRAEQRSLRAAAQARAARAEARREARRDAQRAARREARKAARAAANPLAGRPWGVYRGPQDQVFGPYEASGGETREALGEIALTPRAQWFGAWIPDDQIAGRVREYVDNAQGGDPDALVQMAVFRMVPWEHAACERLPTAAEQASYKRWIDAFAGAVGETPTAIVLQPDGPFSLCAPGGSTLPASLISYAAQRFSELSRTSVYIDAGAGDWPAAGQGGVPRAVDFLVPAGIEYARGIALNSTHYSATEDEVARGSAIVEALAARGIEGKHVVVNTSSNGNPFVFGDYTGPDPDDAFVCSSPTDGRTCTTLGIPPTTDVDAARWGLSESTRALAREHVDAYLWFGRPWLYRQNDPFVLERALGLVRSSPY